MKGVFMFFSLMFCFFASLQTGTAQSYVNAEEASIRMKNQIVTMNVTDIDAIDFGPNANSTVLRYKYYTSVLDVLPQETAMFNPVIDEVFNTLTLNGTAKNTAKVTAIRAELKELLRI